MKFYTANYSYTNHNFVIQNLNEERSESEFLPAILILKNILQRGKPTLMSKFLQSKITRIHRDSDFSVPFTLIDYKQSKWHHTIKGDDKRNYFPAKKFFETNLLDDLPEFEFITQLIRPETPINEITQKKNNKKFKLQCVDFYLPQAFLVIEIDGQQHKVEDAIRLKDNERDDHLSLYNVKTVRIDTSDLENRTTVYKNKIEEIKSRLNEVRFKKVLDYYKNTIDIAINGFPDDIINKKLLPTAIIRFQILILELLERGKLDLNDKNWLIELKNHEAIEFANLVIEDLFIWFKHLLALQKIEFKAPKYKITEFTSQENIKVDFSILKRWTDENDLNKDIIYVRTDYFAIYYDIVTKKMKE